MFRIQDTETQEVLFETSSGAEAGKEAAKLNETFRELGQTRRVRVVRGEVVKEEEQEPAVWAVGSDYPYRFETDEAWIPNYSIKVKVPASGTEWRLREYPKVRYIPWCNESFWRTNGEAWSTHFPHQSSAHAGKLAYTPDEESGKNDRQIRTTPGRYLKKYFGDVLTDEEIQKWALAWANYYAPRELLVTGDPKEIANIYRNGPNSCMAYDFSNLPNHPCEIYGAGDLALAYILEDGGGEVTGRAIVWPEHKVHGRIYGDYERMEEALKLAGYTQGEFAGARLLRIAHNNTFIAPYLDPPICNVSDNGSYLIIDGDGEYELQNTNGLADYGVQCANCEGRVDEDEAYSDPNGYNTYCCDCFHELYSYCEDCDETFPAEDTRFDAANCRVRCQSCHDEHFTECGCCNTEVARDEAFSSPDGVVPLCETCYSDTVGFCEECEEDVYRNDMEDGSDTCKDCVQHSLELEEENTANV